MEEYLTLWNRVEAHNAKCLLLQHRMEEGRAWLRFPSDYLIQITDKPRREG